MGIFKPSKFERAMSFTGKAIDFAATISTAGRSSYLPKTASASASAKKAPKKKFKSSMKSFGDSLFRRNLKGGIDGAKTATTTKSIEDTMQFTQYRNPRAHGWGAEDMNALWDRFRFRKVSQVGRDNSLNGADRIVDGVSIQTKYCRTARESVNAAFNKITGKYRYEGMKLEVSGDQYDDAMKIMAEKISQGKVPGISDPSVARDIVKKGHATYRQSQEVTKAGNSTSIGFDVKSQLPAGGIIASLSGFFTYVRERMNGAAKKDSLKAAGKNAAVSGGSTVAVGVATRQFLRTGAGRNFTAFCTRSSRKIMNVIYRTRIGRKIVTKAASGMVGKNVAGQAAKNVMAKGMRTNMVTGSILLAAQTIPDIIRCSKGKITGGQLAENLASNGTAIAGGYCGWAAGAAMGTAVCPGAGTVIGGLIGSLVGGELGSRTGRGVFRAVRKPFGRHGNSSKTVKVAFTGQRMCA